MDVRINFSCKSPHPHWFTELTFKVGPQNGVTSYGSSMFGGVPLKEQQRQKKLTGLQKQQEDVFEYHKKTGS